MPALKPNELKSANVSADLALSGRVFGVEKCNKLMAYRTRRIFSSIQAAAANISIRVEYIFFLVRDIP